MEPMNTTSSSGGDPHEDEPFMDYINYKNDYCICNLRVEYCDTNCCCDIDCEDYEKLSFSECIDRRKQIYDSRYCSHKNIVYINNTETTLEMSSNGLFCIVWDNTNERHLFDDMKPINDLNRLLDITPQHNYNWSLTNIKRPLKSSESEFFKPEFKLKFGKSLLIGKQTNDTKEQEWALPHSIVFKQGECNSLKKVKYLNDFQSSCQRFIRNLSEDCHQNQYLNANYFKSFDFVSKNFLNRSHSERIYIKIRTEFNDSLDYPLKAPEFDPTERICRNCVKSVEYILQHNGSFGITNVTLNIKETIDIKFNTKWFEQSFGVKFIWFHKSNFTELSGNPGYIVGKPILTASINKDKNVTKDQNGYQILAQNNGICYQNNATKKSIEFGINSRSGCLFKVNRNQSDCKSIQNNILDILKQKNPDLNAVGVFGNSSEDKRSDWTNILISGVPSTVSLTGDMCPITTGTSLHLFYVKAGSVNQPQLKIVGAVKKFHTQTDFHVKCQINSMDCKDIYIELSTSVTFFDITKPSRPDFAPPVTFKIELPSDFFYPFLTDSINYLTPNNILLIISITKLLINELFFC